jgi:glucokinase
MDGCRMPRSSPDHPRLLGDIGGTHARWAWLDTAEGQPRCLETHRCADHASAIASARAYLEGQGLPTPAAIAIGVATAIQGDEVRLTNHPWTFSLEALRQSVGAGRCVAVNDFTALALSLPLLLPSDLDCLGGGAAAAGAPLAVLGPGTGLGVSGLLPCGEDRWHPIAGEGGHVTLAAADHADAALLACLRARHGHVSAERVLSGPGLSALHDAVREVAGAPARSLTAPEIGEAARAGSDGHCVETVRRFSAFLGNVAGNLALTLGAHGGVYVGGGVVAKLGTAFDRQRFRERFESKGRFAAYLRPIPTWLITAPHPALLGASRALDLATANGPVGRR